MPKIFILKRLTSSDLSVFASYFSKFPNTKQKAININTSFFTTVLSPELSAEHYLSGNKEKVPLNLEIFGPGVTGSQSLLKKIIKQQKNWRLNGELIHAPHNEEKRYDPLVPDDIAVFEFDTEQIPLHAKMVLLSRNIESDVEFYEPFSAFLGNRDTVVISYEKLEEIILLGHPVVELLHMKKDEASDLLDLFDELETHTINVVKKNVVPFAHNRILYGAPGTGKSSIIADEAGHEGELFHTIKRITFYPDYNYGQFLGSYKPSPVYRQSTEAIKDYTEGAELKEEPLIDYRLVPGPFLDILSEALLNRNNNYLLIIEEINRANVASVFGDVFQLLDRENDEDSPFYRGSSYSISFNKDIVSYLKKKLNSDEKSPTYVDPYMNEFITKGTIRIPDNLYIWATMNSADQGVMPLDAAFKRRWSFEYLPLDAGEDSTSDWKIDLMGRQMLWNNVRKCINTYLTGSNFRIAEDKLLGPFFMKKEELENRNAVNNKLLLYLKDDVLRHSPAGQFFRTNTFSEIIKAATAKEDSDSCIRSVFNEALAEKILGIPEMIKTEPVSSDSFSTM